MRSKHFALSLLLGFSLLSACGRNDDDKAPEQQIGKMGLVNVDANALYGNWGPMQVPLQDSNGVSNGISEIYIKISKGLIKLVNTCKMSTGDITVEVATAANFTDTEVEMLEKKHAVNKTQKGTCEISTQKGKMNYQLNSDGTLTFRQGYQQPMTLSRVKSTAGVMAH